MVRGRDIIRNQASNNIGEGIHKLYILVVYLQWWIMLQMVGEVRSDSHDIGLRPAYLHTNKDGFVL